MKKQTMRQIIPPIMAIVLAFFAANHYARWITVAIVKAQNSTSAATIVYETKMVNNVTGQSITDSPTTIGINAVGDNYRVAAGRPREIEFRSLGIRVAVTPNGDLKLTGGSGTPFHDQSPGANCENLSGITSESKTIQGFTALKRVQANAEEVVEDWLAPQLGCRMLSEIHQRLSGGVVIATNTTTALSVMLGEPPQAMMTAGNAREVDPSVFYPAMGLKFTPRQMNAYNKGKADRAALGLP
jgi:hypothetical protein